MSIRKKICQDVDDDDNYRDDSYYNMDYLYMGGEDNTGGDGQAEGKKPGDEK